jgi:hypothetical protein
VDAINRETGLDPELIWSSGGVRWH